MKPVKIWMGLLLAFLGLYGGYSGWRLYRLSHGGGTGIGATTAAAAEGVPSTSGLKKGQPVGHFTLTERSGQPFDSDSLKGQVWVASFFFSSCPGACLKLNNTIAQLQQELPDAPVRFVSITVDPKNDTPERLREYARHYQADASRWLFLTGDEESIRRVAQEQFQVAVSTATPMPTHTDRLIVVDSEGKVAGAYRGTEPTEVDLLKRKLAQLTKDQP